MGTLRPALVTLLTMAVGFAAMMLLVGTGPGGEHRLTVTVPEAANLIAGQALHGGGATWNAANPMGEIESVEAVHRGRKAKLTLAVSDEAWPLPQGTKFSVRWGGTASPTNRHIEVTPGPADNPPMAEGATIPAEDFEVPLEVDQLLSEFTPPVRKDLKAMVDATGVTLDRSRGHLERVFERTPPALEQGTYVLGDLVHEPGALSEAIRHTDSVVDAVHRADPQLSALLEGAGRTFAAIAAEQDDLRATLERLPGALEQVQGTLGRADATLQDAGALAGRLRPGVRELRAVAAPLDGVLRSLEEIAPSAQATLTAARRGAPALNALLGRATKVSPQLGSIADGAVENLKCIRPYSPEIAGLLMTWADFMSWRDTKDKTLRAQVQSFLPANYNSVPLSPAQAQELFPGLRYGFPRPPGYNAGQVWYQPDCGAGPDALDPSKDQEAK